MMNTLLETKLFIPKIHTDLVPRTHLIEQLNEGLSRKLTLVSGPAGFGKTSLVLDWISSLDRPAAWLSLDEGDNNLITFFAYLVAALQQVDRSIGQSLQPILSSSQPVHFPTLVTELINDIHAYVEPLVLVLDDYHAIQDISIHEAMRTFLERQPAQLHLVITTRADPALPLARLRAQRQMTEIRANKLRFNQEESAHFLNDLMQLQLKPDEVVLLAARTEGWIAGLQLAALSLRDHVDPAEFMREFSGSDRYVMDYLLDEVLSSQSTEIQNFLLQSSLLERMNGPLCDALLGVEEGYSQDILEYLEQANLFLIPLDNRRGWYRYHHLFAELLRARLRKSPTTRVDELHRHAAAWFEKEGLIPEAIQHALAASENEWVAGLIEQHTPALLESGRLNTLLGWMKSLPESTIHHRPWLAVSQVWAELMAGRPERADALLEEIQSRLEGQPSLTEGEDKRLLRGNLAALQATSAAMQARAVQAKEDAQQALSLLPENAGWTRIMSLMALGYGSRLCGDLEGARLAFEQVVELGRRMDSLLAMATGQFDLGGVYRLQGRLRKAKEVFEDLLNLSEQRKVSGGFSGRAISGLASIFYEQNQLQEALRYLDRSLKLSESWPNPNHDVYSLILLSRVYSAQGEWQKAAEAFKKIESIHQKTPVTPVLTGLRDHNQVRFWLAKGDTAAAVSWAANRNSPADLRSGSMDEFRALEILTTARVWVAGYRANPACDLKRLDQAVNGLDWVIEEGRKAGYGSYLLEAAIMRAIGARIQGKLNQSLELIKEALERAEAEGFLRIFIDYGQPAAELLYEAAAKGISPDYCGRLLASFSGAEVEAARPPALEEEMIEPLSEREVEVLHLIADGFSNSEIAQRLYLSMNTVKGHTRNIYAKLNVNSRTQAVARARALGILSPE
jgi:LuxR family transcriptional regulator, maltose regulon positive regulatory protein